MSIDYSPASVAAHEFERAIPPGAPVVVFANSASTGDGYAAAVEGFMTACGGGEPVGMRGMSGTWAEMSSLDDVLRAATPGS